MNEQNKINDRFVSVIPVIILIIIWEIFAQIGNSPLFPPFSDVIKEFYNLIIVRKILFYHFSATLIRILIGFCLGSIFGLAMGVFLGCNKLAEKTMSPIIAILYPIPALGWLPLLMLWVGINEALPIIIIFISSFFPIAYNTITGVKNIDKRYIRAAKTLGATNKQILVKIILPLAIPNIFTGLRLQSGMAWRVVIAAEMVAISSGIGVLMLQGESLIRVDIIIVSLMMLSIMCVLFEKIFIYFEYRLTKNWR